MMTPAAVAVAPQDRRQSGRTGHLDQPDRQGLDELLRVQRARAMGSEGGGLDDLIACVRKLVSAGGCKSRPGSRQGAW